MLPDVDAREELSLEAGDERREAGVDRLAIPPALAAGRARPRRRLCGAGRDRGSAAAVSSQAVSHRRYRPRRSTLSQTLRAQGSAAVCRYAHEMRGRSVPILALAAFAAIVPAALLHFVGREKVLIGGWIHFGGVAFGAGIATLCAVALTIAGARQRDGYAVLVGSAFSVMAALLCLHGLATPGLFVDDGRRRGVHGRRDASDRRRDPRARRALGASSPAAVRPLLWLLGAGVVFIFGLGIAAIVRPGLVPSVPEPRSPAAWVVLVRGLAFYAVLFWRALRTYRLTRRRADLLVAVGIVWLAAALPAALLLDFRDLGWWLGHAFEIVGIAAVGFTVAHDLRRGAARSRPLLGDLGAPTSSSRRRRSSDPTSARSSSSSPRRTPTRRSTRAASRFARSRSATSSGSSPGRLRDLAIGGLLHDIGKLAVPDAILKKPGPLTDEEFHVVMRHVVHGSRAAARARRLLSDRCTGSCAATTSASTAPAIRRRVAGDPIPLDVGSSPCATCTTRSSPSACTGSAWSHERALEHLRPGSGKLSTRSCVEALADVLARERRADLAVAV